MKNVLILVGAGQIGLAIVRRIGYGKKIIVADNNIDNAIKTSNTLNQSGFDSVYYQVDISNQESILNLIKQSKKHGKITMFVNSAGVSPSQASIETILKVDLYGTAILLDEIGKVIEPNGVGLTISSQSGHRLDKLSKEQDLLLATTDCDKLLDLSFLKKENIKDTLHAYQLSKYCNHKRVMFESLKWAKKNARINSISPGIVITPLALDELNGINADFYQKMIKEMPINRTATPDEIANVAELLLTEKGQWITGSDFLVDGGATANYFYKEYVK